MSALVGAVIAFLVGDSIECLLTRAENGTSK